MTKFVIDSDTGISASLTRLASGETYLVAGLGVSILSQSNGQVVISAATAQPRPELFGTGVDGAYSASSGVLTLSRDMYFSSIDLSGTAQIMTNGFRLFCNGVVNLVSASALAICFAGNAGGNGASNGAAGTAGATVPDGTIAGNLPGTQGGSSATNSNGTTAIQPTLRAALGGSSNISGAGGAGVGGVAGGLQLGRDSVDFPIYDVRKELFIANDIVHGGLGAPGGGGGGSSGGPGGGGGGGGSGGGVLQCYLATVVVDTSTAASTFDASGGDGGNGGSPAAGNTGGAGGGSGAGGGYVYLIVGSIIGHATDVVSANGGDGGAGGNSAGTGNSGNGGSGGNGGRIVCVHLDANDTLFASGSVGGAGLAGGGGLGSTGGAGGAMGTCLLSF